jgi:hypothetical protein
MEHSDAISHIQVVTYAAQLCLLDAYQPQVIAHTPDLYQRNLCEQGIIVKLATRTHRRSLYNLHIAAYIVQQYITSDGLERHIATNIVQGDIAASVLYLQVTTNHAYVHITADLLQSCITTDIVQCDLANVLNRYVATYITNVNDGLEGNAQFEGVIAVAEYQRIALLLNPGDFPTGIDLEALSLPSLYFKVAANV